MVLDKHKERDTVTAMNLYYYGFTLSKTDNDAAVQYVKQGTVLAKELKWNEGWVGACLVCLACTHFRINMIAQF